MAIYRGDGGAGDATDDITINQVTTLTQEAADSATAAASSASAASTSASNAAASASAASTSASNAATSATNAASSATAAASSASAASTSATAAASSASAAASSASAASASETAAAASEAAAATSETNAAASEAAAATSETNAASSASSASTSATNAATSETNAAASEAAAATSEANAATSETNAAASEAAAATSETNAAASETAAASSASSASSSASSASSSASSASTSASNAATSESNAATSEANAAASESAAATSETNAAASASAASTSASNAATSETNAANSATSAASSATAAAASAASAASSDFANFQSAGTANGVAYLNGSKVLTTGSALVFDGTNLGVGTSSPGDKLHVAGTIRFGANASYYGTITHDAASTGANIYNHTDSGGHLFQIGGTTLLNLTSSGNLGLGVTPSAWNTSAKALQIGAYTYIGQQSSGSANFAWNCYQDSVGFKYLTSNPALLEQLGNDGVYRWFTAPSGTAGNAISFTQAMTLDANGDFGLGTTTLTTSTGYKTISLSGSTGGQIAFQTGGVGKQYIYSNATDLNFYNSVTGNLIFHTSGSERARIDSSGNLLVGATSATYSSSGRGLVEINGSSNSLLALKTGGSAAGYLYHDGTALSLVNTKASYIQFTTNSIDAARIDSSGNLLVGTTSTSDNSGVGFKIVHSTTPTPYVTQTVDTSNAGAGTYHLYNVNATNNGYRFYVRSNGGISNYSGNNVNLSDERTKTNIELAGDYLYKVCAIPVKLFNYKDEAEGEQRTLGVIAQDVEAVAPELVNLDGWKDEVPEGEEPLKSIYTTDMMFALMKAIQEQQAIINAQQAELDSLKARLDAANL